MASGRKYKPMKSELDAIYRLEFYKNKKDWKFGSDAKKNTSADIEMEPKRSLNKSYEMETEDNADGVPPLNKAFLHDQPVDKITPRSVSSDPGPTEQLPCQDAYLDQWPDVERQDHKTEQEWRGIEAGVPQELAYDAFDQAEWTDENSSFFVPYEHLKKPEIPPPLQQHRPHFQHLTTQLGHLQPQYEYGRPSMGDIEDLGHLESANRAEPRPELLETLLANLRKRYNQNGPKHQPNYYGDLDPQIRNLKLQTAEPVQQFRDLKTPIDGQEAPERQLFFDQQFENLWSQLVHLKPRLGAADQQSRFHQEFEESLFWNYKPQFEPSEQQQLENVKFQHMDVKPPFEDLKPQYGAYGDLNQQFSDFKPLDSKYGQINRQFGDYNNPQVENINPMFGNFNPKVEDVNHKLEDFKDPDSYFNVWPPADLLSKADACLQELGVECSDEDFDPYEALGSQSRDFVRGAHNAPHSSETDLSVDCQCVNASLLHILTTRQLASALQTHVLAVRRLLVEQDYRNKLNSVEWRIAAGAGRGWARAERPHITIVRGGPKGWDLRLDMEPTDLNYE